MFVLPPPPRYPNGNLYTGMPGSGGILETNNLLEHPADPDFHLVLGEGTYALKDDLHLATPPPHPSDTPQPNNNPLATKLDPPASGTKLSLAVLSSRRPPSQSLFRTATAHSARSNLPLSIQEEAQSPRSDAGSITNGFGSPSYWKPTPVFGQGNPALAPAPTSKGKKDAKGKPKNNIAKSNSSFISRVIAHEALQRRLADRLPAGIFAFANVNRSFCWLDLSSEAKAENLVKILFTRAHALCHDVNQTSKSPQHLDVIIGFNTADVIWYEAMSQKYARLNKNGMINKTAVSSIHWLPNHKNFFLAAHMDGSLVVYDKEREDGELVPEDALASETDAAAANGASSNGNAGGKLQTLKSVQSKNQTSNPVAAWRFSRHKINSVAFSPDGQYLAAAGDDGTLTVMDFVNERITDVFRSYYGALLSVTWSPDGRYVLTGGQDDLVSIWSIAEQALVARCVGHESWVRDVKFDPWRCDERNYRFGSVGEDCRLLLWDFSVGMLGKPRAVSLLKPRGSSAVTTGTATTATATATMGGTAHRRESSLSAGVNRLRSNSGLARTATATATDDETGLTDNGELVHAVEPKGSKAVLPPVSSNAVDTHPLYWLGFEEKRILTSCKDGHIREWERPHEAMDAT